MSVHLIDLIASIPLCVFALAAQSIEADENDLLRVCHRRWITS